MRFLTRASIGLASLVFSGAVVAQDSDSDSTCTATPIVVSAVTGSFDGTTDIPIGTPVPYTYTPFCGPQPTPVCALLCPTGSTIEPPCNCVATTASNPAAGGTQCALACGTGSSLAPGCSCVATAMTTAMTTAMMTAKTTTTTSLAGSGAQCALACGTGSSLAPGCSCVATATGPVSSPSGFPIFTNAAAPLRDGVAAAAAGAVLGVAAVMV